MQDNALIEHYARQYAALVPGTPNGATIAGYRSLAEHNRRLVGVLQGFLYWELVSGDPYANADEMVADFRDNGRLLISDEHNEHPVWSEHENVLYRVVHNAAHLSSWRDGLPYQFDWRGEFQAYSRHVVWIGDDELAVKANRMDTLAFVAFRLRYGFYPSEQMAGLAETP